MSTEISLRTLLEIQTQIRGLMALPGKMAALVIDLDSPGGSWAEAEVMSAELRQKRLEGVPKFVFVRGMAASAGYQFAVAGVKIFCKRSSLLGCMGTHIERPKEEHLTTVVVATSGERKSGNTCKQSQSQLFEDTQDMADGIAQTFRDLVIACKSGLVQEEFKNDALSGAMFHGVKAVHMGLSDDFYQGTLEESIAQQLGLNEEDIQFKKIQ